MRPTRATIRHLHNPVTLGSILDRHAVELRDLATTLLGDPYEADLAARLARVHLRTESNEDRRKYREKTIDPDQLRDALEDELVSVCLERTGCSYCAEGQYERFVPHDAPEANGARDDDGDEEEEAA